MTYVTMAKRLHLHRLMRKILLRNQYRMNQLEGRKTK